MSSSPRRTPRRKSARRGLTLLEVLLSIAILGAAIATIGELIRVGSRSAARARDMTRAQMLAETKMAEITTGAVPLTSVTESTFEYDPEWLFSILVEPVDSNGLQSVTLVIDKNVDRESRGVSYQLVRWVREEDLDFTEETEGTETTESSSSGSGGSDSGGASGGGDTGGGGRG